VERERELYERSIDFRDELIEDTREVGRERASSIAITVL